MYIYIYIYIYICTYYKFIHIHYILYILYICYIYTFPSCFNLITWSLSLVETAYTILDMFQVNNREAKTT